MREQSPSGEAVATITFLLLLAAAVILFLLPHYLTFGVQDGPSLQLGAWTADETSSEPWKVGDYGQLRHLRYADGSTCTQILTGPFVTQFCR